MSKHSEIPVGTRVICVRDLTRTGFEGLVGVVIEPLEVRWCISLRGDAACVAVYGVDFGLAGVVCAEPCEIRPLPPEDDVKSFDRANRDVELEVC